MSVPLMLVFLAAAIFLASAIENYTKYKHCMENYYCKCYNTMFYTMFVYILKCLFAMFVYILHVYSIQCSIQCLFTYYNVCLQCLFPYYTFTWFNEVFEIQWNTSHTIMLLKDTFTRLLDTMFDTMFVYSCKYYSLYCR